MPTVFETCVPREDVLKGTIAEADFAADPAKAQTSPSTYDPRMLMLTEPQLLVLMSDLESFRIEPAAKPFDTQPCIGSTLDDLALDLFLSTYRVQAIAREVLEGNNRPGLSQFNLSAQPVAGSSGSCRDRRDSVCSRQ